jgi:DNA-binding transcriptional regulator YiaG
MALASYLSEHRLTDAEFAARLGVSDEVVRLWRHGTRQMSPKAAKAV